MRKIGLLNSVFLNILNVVADFDSVRYNFITRTINGAVLVVRNFGHCCEEATVWTDTFPTWLV